MFGGMNPKQMKAMMSQLGIKQQEIDAEEVIIKGKEKNIVIKNPSVSKINFSGQDMFQISGQAEEQAKEEISEDDINTVMLKARASKEKAIAAMKENDGDIASAIMSLKSEK